MLNSLKISLQPFVFDILKKKVADKLNCNSNC